MMEVVKFRLSVLFSSSNFFLLFGDRDTIFELSLSFFQQIVMEQYHSGVVLGRCLRHWIHLVSTCRRLGLL